MMSGPLSGEGWQQPVIQRSQAPGTAPNPSTPSLHMDLGSLPPHLSLDPQKAKIPGTGQGLGMPRSHQLWICGRLVGKSHSKYDDGCRGLSWVLMGENHHFGRDHIRSWERLLFDMFEYSDIGPYLCLRSVIKRLEFEFEGNFM